MQLREQRQPVGTQRRVVGIDHHLVEERIDRRLQRGQGLQRCFQVAGIEGGAGLRRHLPQLLEQGQLGRIDEQRDAHLTCRCAVGLLQDVAHTLVGCGQCRRLGQRGESLQGGESLGQFGPARRPQFQNRVHLLRAVAQLAQVAHQPLTQEQGQFGLHLAVGRAEDGEGAVNQRLGVQRQLALGSHAVDSHAQAALQVHHEQRACVDVGGGVGLAAGQRQRVLQRPDSLRTRRGIEAARRGQPPIHQRQAVEVA